MNKEEEFSAPPNDIRACLTNECVQCGELMTEDQGNFCSDYCYRENAYINRTCQTCGGEFWDGGTSCDCEDFEQEPEDYDDLWEDENIP